MTSSRPVLLLFTLTALLTGCASQDKDKPWKRAEPKWYQTDMSPDDREFYRQFFLGN